MVHHSLWKFAGLQEESISKTDTGLTRGIEEDFGEEGLATPLVSNVMKDHVGDLQAHVRSLAPQTEWRHLQTRPMGDRITK